MTINQKLLEAIKSRQNSKQTLFGYGVSTADRYVKTVEQCVGHELCNRYVCSKSANWQDIITKASNSLVYSNEDMLTGSKLITSLTGWKEVLGIDDSTLELPKNTLMVFSHTLTTPRKDRDGDRLRSEGAKLDPKMLLLWQHIPTLPIGKMLAILEQNAKRVRNASCIIDMNDLCHDAAVMIDNDMGRYSHGFRALAFNELKEAYDPETGPNGYDITSYEIMEESLVSVPSNVDAETEEVILSLVESSKLTSDLMKARGKSIREKRPVSVNVTKQIEDSNEDKSRSGSSEEQAGECECQGECACTSKEAHEDSASKTKSTSDPQVKRINGPLEGSWEWIGNCLRQQAKSFIEQSRITSVRDRFVWVVATYPENAVICCEGYECGVADEFMYFQADWELVEGKPTFTGSPVAVDIVTTVEITERSPIWEDKSAPSSTKAGRVLSQRNLAKLTDVKDDLEELKGGVHISTRAGSAICERCIKKLEEVIGDAGGVVEEEDTRQMSVDQAIGEIVSNADKDERARLKRYLEAMDSVDASIELGNQFRTLIAG
jgi:hypothetical protein